MQANSFEQSIANDIGGMHDDPLGFVLYAFDWGQGDLEGCDGPDEWQRSLLKDLGQGVVSASEAIRFATASGHGIGKSAVVAWVILWAMSTRPHLAGVITANTGAQLNDKTWRELSVWHKRSINAHWFRWTATKFYQVDNPETWFVSAIPWSKERPEAFAGLHAEHVLMLFDEASAIDDVIWETAEGAMTTKGAIWCVFGNPTRNSGRFHGCFHRFKHRWNTRQIDSRAAKMTNKAQLNQWIEDYGEDSDFVRIRVRGVFPRAGNCQLIASDMVESAMGRVLGESLWRHAPKVMGLDVARFGDDQSVIALRQGLALCKPLQKHRGMDTMTLAGIAAGIIDKEQVDMCFVDVGGVGAGVVDRLHQLGFRDRVIGVDFGGRALEPVLYLNKRTEMWCLMRDWLPQAMLPEDEELRTDLTAPEYSFTGDKGQIALERKKDMKARGLASPDCADALALTFAMPVTPRHSGRTIAARTDYDVAGYGMPQPRHQAKTAYSVADYGM